MADPLKTAKEMAAYNNRLYTWNWQKNAEFNKQEAAKNRNWQERMANSAHQREIADLKAAGLNPVLSVTGGNGAPTGSGSAASAQQAPVDTSLPMAVIDMATAQLNNATRLQEMAMQTQSAQWIAQYQAQADLQRHITPSGSTAYGQVMYALDQFANIFGYSSAADILKSKGGTDIDALINDLKYGGDKDVYSADLPSSFVGKKLFGTRDVNLRNVRPTYSKGRWNLTSKGNFSDVLKSIAKKVKKSKKKR